MDNLRTFGPATEVKIFDPRDPSSSSGGAELLDASVVQRDDQWWLYLAGQAHGFGATDIYSPSLPSRAPVCGDWVETHSQCNRRATASFRPEP